MTTTDQLASVLREAVTLSAAVRGRNGGLKGLLAHADDLEQALAAYNSAQRAEWSADFTKELDGLAKVHPTLLRSCLKGELEGAFERGRQQGMEQANALAELVRDGQELGDYQPAASSAQEPVDQLMAEMRALGEATLRTPGQAVKVPELVATEGRKFMRGEPSLFDRVPLGDVASVASVLEDAAPARLAGATQGEADVSATEVLEVQQIRRYLDGLVIPTRNEDGEPLSLIGRINVMNAKCVKAKKELAESRYQTALSLERKLEAAEEEIERLQSSNPQAPAATQPEPDQTLWLWMNGDHYLAFEHLYPCHSPGGDPMTLGEPFGRAVFRKSFNRSGK